MKRLTIIAVGALALAGCGSTTTPKTASACVLAESGTKLCGQDALKWCEDYANVGTECNLARAEGWIAKDRRWIAENCSSAYTTREGCGGSKEEDITHVEEAMRSGNYTTQLVIHAAEREP